MQSANLSHKLILAFTCELLLERPKHLWRNHTEMLNWYHLPARPLWDTSAYSGFGIVTEALNELSVCGRAGSGGTRGGGARRRWARGGSISSYKAVFLLCRKKYYSGQLLPTWSMVNGPCSSLKIKQGSGPTKRRTRINLTGKQKLQKSNRGGRWFLSLFSTTKILQHYSHQISHLVNIVNAGSYWYSKHVDELTANTMTTEDTH